MVVKSNPVWIPTPNKKEWMMVTTLHGTRREIQEFFEEIGKTRPALLFDCLDDSEWDMQLITDLADFFVVLEK